jgi:NADH:ubiquinone oxidoreductase subunit 5 (subunit L)/multisubunit Na+/H+ antiporter MnhA subunit
MNKLGDITLLLATIHVYNLFATTNNKIINSIVYLLICDKLLAFIGISLIICAMTKCAQHILHTWLPDAMEGPTPVSALLHSSTMVTAGYILFTKYVSFISSNGAFPDLIIFIGIFSYLTGVINSVGSEDGKGALAYSTVAQTGNLFSGTIILSSGFMLLGFITHGVYKAGSFMAGGTSSLNDNVGQEDEGNESD